jgi:hypothetical protein
MKLPPFAKNDKIYLIKLVACDMIFSSMVIPKVSPIPLLIPRVAADQIKRKSLWDLCISHMRRVFQRSSNV